MITFILGALIATTLTLPAFARLIRQRDAAKLRGDLALSELDAQIEETNWQRTRSNQFREAWWEEQERRVQLEAEALPVLPPWSGPPSLRVVADVEPLIWNEVKR